MTIEEKHTNGIQIYYAPNPGMQRFCIGVYIRAGVLYESKEQNGYAHLLEHMIFRNCKARYGNDFYKLLTLNSLDFEACTYKEMLSFTFTGLSRGLPFAKEILERLFDDINITADDFNTEKERIKAELREEDEKSRLSYLCNKRIWEGTNLERTITGGITNISRATRSSINSYKNRCMVKDNICVVLTGNIGESDYESITKALNKTALNSEPPKNNIAEVPIGFMNRVTEPIIKERYFTSLDFSFDFDKAVENHHCIDRLYDIILTGYDSMLIQELSENRGMVYSIDGSIERYSNIGVINFNMEAEENNLTEIITSIVALLNKVKRGEFDYDTVLQKRINYTIEGLDDIEALNFQIAFDHILFGHVFTPEEDIEIYRGISKEQIAALAKELFTTKNLTLGIQGNKRKIGRSAENIKDILNQLDI